MQPQLWQLACQTQTKTSPAWGKWLVAENSWCWVQGKRGAFKGLISNLVMVAHNELWWGYVWSSMQVKIPIWTAVVGWRYSQFWSKLDDGWVAELLLFWCMSLLRDCLHIMWMTIFCVFVWLWGGWNALQSVLSPCLEVINTWLPGSYSDRVTNDVQLTGTCTQDCMYPFKAW